MRRHGEHEAMACLAHRVPPPHSPPTPRFQKGPVFLLFLQLLHGALVREHRGDGCKYLIAGDLLAAGHVPHFGRQERSTAGYMNRHTPAIRASGRFYLRITNTPYCNTLLSTFYSGVKLFCSVFYLCEAFGQSLRRTIETPMPASSRILKQACKHDTDMILAAP